MDTSASVQVSRLQEPEVVALKVAHRHAILSGRALFEVKSLKFCNLIHSLCRGCAHWILILVVENIEELLLFAGHRVTVLARILLLIPNG
jgi:hypothetical protein